jgi:tetratricopeptide (TPR) repeat protein
VAKGGVIVYDQNDHLPWSLRFFQLLDAIIFHVHAWFSTRRLVLLIQGTPALLFAVALVVLFVVHRRGPDRDLITRYELAVEQALEHDDPMSAKVYVRKLVLLDEPGPQARYGLARLAEYEGDLTRAIHLMEDLAPYPGSGYPAAHFWMGMHLLESEAADDADYSVKRDMAIHHFEQALRTPSVRDQAHQRLAELYLEKNDSRQALRHLEEAAPGRPELYLPLAKIYLRNQDDARLQRALRQAREYFRSRVAVDPKDRTARVAWAEACRLDGDLVEAERILQEGLALGDDAALRNALAETTLAIVEQQGIGEAHNLSQLIDLLTKALQTAPDHPEVVNRLAMFLRYSGASGELMRGRLRDLLASGQAPATMHLLVGSSAVAEGHWAIARRHLEQAYRLNSRLPALLNQLAWALACGEPPELERALRLAETAVELSPDEPELLATRGKVLARLERWQEALTDLEAVLTSGSEQGELHATLAEVYTALGDAEMAKRHQALAARRGKKPAFAKP